MWITWEIDFSSSRWTFSAPVAVQSNGIEIILDISSLSDRKWDAVKKISLKFQVYWGNARSAKHWDDEGRKFLWFNTFSPAIAKRRHVIDAHRSVASSNFTVPRKYQKFHSRLNGRRRTQLVENSVNIFGSVRVPRQTSRVRVVNMRWFWIQFTWRFSLDLDQWISWDHEKSITSA